MTPNIMEGNGEEGGGDALPPIFQRTLPEDAAEYMLFVLGGGQAGEETAASKPLAMLDRLRKAALRLSEELTVDYIWQREAFNLEVVSRKGLLYLRGLTGYGDCVEDEWLIVYMLRELSKSFPGVWARIGDSDGEFLLVEAAKAVPRWLNPEMDANRIWIHDGQLKIIPRTGAQAAEPMPAVASDQSSITLAEAVQIIKTAPDTLLHIPALENEAFHRLQKYPGHVQASIHHTRLILPRKIAYILHDRPRAVAPAVEAFSLRDRLTTQRIFESQHPETDLQFAPADLVIISVKFTRVLYAQLRGQRFTPPKGWPGLYAAYAEATLQPKEGKGKRKGEVVDGETMEVMAELGMKLACGFELMASAAETCNNRIVREVALVLEDLAEDGDDATALPSDEEIRGWKDFDREDDDSWLDINFEDFERELDSGRQEQKGISTPTPRATAGRGEAGPDHGFGDAGVQTDLRRIVSQFQSFLNDNDAGIEGAEFDEMDEDDDGGYGDDDGSDSDEEDGVDFDEEEFSRLMREMMGLPPSDTPKAKVATSTTTAVATTERRDGRRVDAVVPRNLVGSDEGNIDEEEGILKLAAQFEAELKGHGALRLNPPKNGKEAASSATKNITAEGETGNSGAADETESDDDGEVDVDFNLAKNLLESFKGQDGMSGPAGNILSMLGLSLPRDDDEDDEEDK